MLCACCQAIDLRKRAKYLAMRSLADRLEQRHDRSGGSIPYQAILEAILSAISQGCEFCGLLWNTYRETPSHLEPGPGYIYNDDSTKVTPGTSLPFDSIPSLAFKYGIHYSITPATLINLDPDYKKVLQKAVEEESEDQTIRQFCVTGLTLDFLSSATIGGFIHAAALGLLADKST
jgi:hypothetical protein